MASEPRFQPYLQILSSLVNQAKQIAIHGRDGELLASLPATPTAGLRSAVASVAVQLARHKGGQIADVRLLVDGSATYVLHVHDGAGEIQGLLALQCASARVISESPDIESIRSICAPALALLGREFDAIARKRPAGDDASLQQLEPEGSGSEPTHGLISEAMLDVLVKRSNLNGALLYLPAAGLEMLLAPAGTPQLELDQLRRVTVHHLFANLSKSGAPIIVNKIREASTSELVPWRILCVPLTRGSITVGMIAGLRPRTGEALTPSDENLLQRLADRLYGSVEASYDEATGLLSRQAFEDNALRCLETDVHRPRCVVYGDLDRLHMVNDLFGFSRGDEILRAVANIWHRSALPKGSLVSRLSGDRFVGLLNGFTLNQARAWAEQLRANICAIKPPAECAGLDVSASFGIAAISAESTLNHALAASETACKAAKDRGRNRVELFADTDASLMQRHDDLRVFRDLVDALDSDRFKLYAQPLRPLADPTRPTHYEILIRMLDSSGSIVLPAKFLSAATRYQLFMRLDQWVIARTLKSLKQYCTNLRNTSTMFWINVSGQSLAQEEFADFVRTAVRDSGLPPGSIGFEITESAAIGNMELAQQFMSRLRELGCNFALDDFGTGLSSLRYLKDLKVSMLKIDGSFIRDLLRDPRSDSLVRAVLRVAGELHLETTAECIETPETAYRLSELGVNYGQGFELGRPGPLDDLLAAQFEPDSEATNDLQAPKTASG
ncbi:MAG: EAL domain-containing protein [Proteobacteria bacterium]|nr:EAL domain-containing protein [Pseudomonadota bacterium]